LTSVQQIWQSGVNHVPGPIPVRGGGRTSRSVKPMPSGRDENDPSPAAISGVRTYEPGSADQLTASPRPDITPSDPGAREVLARTVALQAVVYGLPSVYQYASMCAQCAPSGDDDLWSLNEFSHSREPAGPNYQAFRVPNVDTLY